MGFIKQEREEKTLLKAEGAISIYEAASLREYLLSYLKENNELVLDLSEVSECDTAGVQLLCSARITAEQEGMVFEVTGASGPVIDAMTRAGLNPAEILNSNIEAS
ncbi:STAS domain-containing protein [Desulfobacterales bacterium HSG2]|nr:STAS domain-containing protein [Desulfobacterales bacterium HSG2]